MSRTDGTAGWDDYAPFYDWENARTLGRRDVAFWRDVVKNERAPVLELGCGTGRLLMPLARTGLRVAGVDRSRPMLQRAIARARRLPRAQRPSIARADIRALPFATASFGVVVAPYGMLQSLVRDADLDAALADAARVLRRGGLFGVDLVPDLPSWSEYRREVRMRGRASAGRRVTLVESVRQDRRRRLTIFDEEFVVRTGRRTERHRFSLTFRTLAVPSVMDRLARAGLGVESAFGSYGRDPLEDGSDAWLILARKC